MGHKGAEQGEGNTQPGSYEKHPGTELEPTPVGAIEQHF